MNQYGLEIPYAYEGDGVTVLLLLNVPYAVCRTCVLPVTKFVLCVVVTLRLHILGI